MEIADLECKIKFKEYTVLSEAQKKEVLNYRNMISIRKHMYNQDIIREKDHFEWINSLKGDRTRRYYAILYNTEIVGSFNLNDINLQEKTCCWGFFLGKKPLRAMGSIAVYFFIEKIIKMESFKIIYAGILKENTKSIELHKRVGFYNSEEGSKSKKEIKMEWNIDSWLKTYKERIEVYIKTANQNKFE